MMLNATLSKKNLHVLTDSGTYLMMLMKHLLNSDQQFGTTALIHNSHFLTSNDSHCYNSSFLCSQMDVCLQKFIFLSFFICLFQILPSWRGTNIILKWASERHWTRLIIGKRVSQSSLWELCLLGFIIPNGFA